MILLKFGGTSVKDQDAIAQLVEIVRGPAPRAAVVVSALAGVTDQLLGVAESAAAGDAKQAMASIENIRLRHHSVSVVVSDPERRRALGVQLDREFRALSEIVGALVTLRDASPRWLDAIAATGELGSSRLVAAALNARGVPAEWVDARTAIVTNEDFMSAAPDMDATLAAVRQAFEPPLSRGQVPVMGGFVGATTRGVTTTLGRGGSDFSGAIVGAALDASEIQIWTDVDGMLTADPRIIRDAQVVPHLSFAEASELAHFGAKVLHPATILPAVSKNIPVRILNSRRPEAPGTLITGERMSAPNAHGVTAIASKSGITMLNITSTKMVMAHGFLRRLFEVFETNKTAVDVVTTSEASVSVTVEDARRLPAITAALSEFADVSTEDGMAIVCAVGDALPSNSAAAGDILGALSGLPLRMVSQAASRRNVTIVLRAEDLEAALGRLHERFVTAGSVVS